MKKARAIALGTAIGLLSAGCGPHPPVTPTPPRPDLVVLLRDEATGALGSAHVSNNVGVVELGADRDAAWVVAPTTSPEIRQMSEEVALPFFPPTDFLSMDQFAADNNLPMGFAYPHDSPTSPELSS